MPTPNKASRDRVLVVGDLVVDLRVAVQDRSPGTIRQAVDLTVVGSSTIHIGGTAFLFGRALQSASHYVAYIVGAVGDDAFGAAVLRQLKTELLSDALVQTTSLEATPVIPLLTFEDGTRLMARPPREILPIWNADQILAKVGEHSPNSFKLVFISGYTIATRRDDVVDAVRRVCDWARGTNVPIVVDLVPHEFAEFVGSLDRVTDLIGKPNGYVAELRTTRGLGLCAPDITSIAVTEQLRLSAANLTKNVDFAVVQHQLASSVYGQIFATPTHVSPLERHSFNERDRTGLGDKLLVRTLMRHEII